MPIRLVVVGEGTAAAQVAERAAEVNDRHGAEVITLTGGLVDPRPAYEVADLMLGMGGSALRSMAFAKPLVVLGEQGFSLPLEESSRAYFRQHGWYGLGDGDLSPDRIADQVRPLVTDPARRAELGALGRRIVTEQYGLEPAAAGLVRLYERVAARRPRRLAAAVEGGRTAAMLGSRKLPAPVTDRVRALRGRGRNR
jgi:hypothetical protein